jgi:hypothetical protein
MAQRVAVIGGTGAVLAAFLLALPAEAGLMPIQGTWRLDDKASKNVPDQARNVDLKITIKGKMLATERLVDTTPVGEPIVIPVDGVPIEREIAKGQRGTIKATWKAEGKLLEQVIETKQGGLIPVIQTTLITVTDDGSVMTRVQTTRTGGDVTERVLIYRRRQ